MAQETDSQAVQQFDELEALLSAELNRRNEGEEEAVVVEKKPHNPVYMIANILGKRKAVQAKALEQFGPSLSLLASYLSTDGNVLLAQTLAKQNGHLGNGEISTILLSDQVLQEQIALSLPNSISFQEYMQNTAEQFGKHLGYLLSLNMTDIPMETDLKKDTPEENATNDGFMFEMAPESLMVAGAIYQGLSGYETRLASLKNSSELAQLVFIRHASSFLTAKAQEQMQAQIKGDASLDGLVKRTLILLAKEKQAQFKDIDIDATLQHYERIMSSVWGFARSLESMLTPLKDVEVNYKTIAGFIAKKMEEQTGLLFEMPEYVDELEEYNELKEQLKGLKIKLYEAKPFAKGARLKYGELVRTARALKGDFYKDGMASVEDIPIGSIGKIYDDYVHFPAVDEYGHMKADELDKLEAVFEPDAYQIGDRVKIVHAQDENYGYHYGGTTQDVAIGAIGTVERIDHEDKIIIKLKTGKDWALRPEELELTTPRKVDKTTQERKDVILKNIDGIIQKAEEEANSEYARKNQLITQGVSVLKATGLSESAVSLFFKRVLGSTTEYRKQGIVPEFTVMKELFALQEKINYKKLQETIVKSINTELGIYFDSDNVETAGDFTNFKAKLPEQMAKGVKLTEKIRTKNFKPGDVAVALRTYDYVKEGTPITIRKLYDGYNDAWYVLSNGRERIYQGALRSAQRIVDLTDSVSPLKVMKKGVSVRIRKDSEYYVQTIDEGVLLGSYKQGTPNEWIGVKFNNGYQNEYRITDLEMAHPDDIKRQLKGDALEAYEDSLKKAEALKKDLEAKVLGTIAKVEQEYAQIPAQVTAISQKFINDMRSLRFADKDIYAYFTSNLRDTQYLRDQNLLEVKK
jgi:hypothetical protein